MFVFSWKTSKNQLFWASVCVVLAAAILLSIALWPATSNGAIHTAAVATADEGIAYLQTLGYTATGGDVREVIMPDTLDETLTQYNALQQTAGMDLTPYCGKRLKYRTYTVTDHPAGEAQAHLYLYKNTVVAGDISSPSADGFRQALLPRTATRSTHGTTG